MPRPRGAIMSPRHVLAAARPHQLRANVPSSFGVVPTQLSYWLNNQDGDCVTAEEAYAKGAWSVMLGLPELFVPDAEVQRWAQAGGFLNGAVLSDVMAAMAKSGFQVNGVEYTDGPPESVDYTNWATLTSALSSGPVKVGIDADNLENVVQQTNGWFGTGWNQSDNQDHCVSLSGYGTVAECYGFLQMPVPSEAQARAGDNAVLLFTWNTIGVVLFPSMVTAVSEAWLRTPTTPQQVGPTPAPTPTPGVPATALWLDKPSKSLHVPAGWIWSANNLNPTVVVHPNNQIVDVPKGWSQV